jgi:hypothetical protein
MILPTLVFFPKKFQKTETCCIKSGEKPESQN